MTTTNDDSDERGEPDLTFLESRPARVAEIANLALGRSSIGERPRSVDSRALTIGRDIRLSGQITECELLIVEGHLDATVPDAKSMEIAQTGHFKGTAKLGDAIVSGEFEGDLTVTNRLLHHQHRSRNRYNSIRSFRDRERRRDTWRTYSLYLVL